MILHKTVSLIIEQDGKVLLVKRKHGPYKGYWTPSGGHIEKGETPLEAAMREGLEEVGPVALKSKPFMKFRHPWRIGHYHLAHMFRGKPAGRMRAASDAAALRWVKPEQLGKLNITDYTIAAITKLYPKLKFDDRGNRKK